MKKYSFLVYHKEYNQFLQGIQELGVVHVIEKETGEFADEELKTKYHLISELNQAIKFLSKREVAKVEYEADENGLTILEELKKLWSDEESYHQKLSAHKKEIQQLTPWGDFKWETIEKLSSVAIITKFYTCPTRMFSDDWKINYNLEKINEISGTVYFVLFSNENELIEIDAEEIKLPQKSLSKLKKDYEEISGIIDKTQDLYNDFAARYIDILTNERDNLLTEFDFKKVILNTSKEAEEKLMLLEGWVPEDSKEDIQEYLEKQGIYYLIDKPNDSDKIPIKLKNSKFAKLFEPIGKLYMLPSYGELDLTPFFAPFFMLFFGFCLGDAGYGIFILIAALIMRSRVKPKLKPFLNLGIFFSLATILFGLISGTFFGINLIDSGYTLTNGSMAALASAGVPQQIINSLSSLVGKSITEQASFLKEIKSTIGNQEIFDQYKILIVKYAESKFIFIDKIRYLMLDTNKMMILSLLLGYVQIVFGMFIKAVNIIRMRGFKYSLSTFGWILLVFGGGILYLLKYLNILTPDSFNTLVLIIGIIAAVPILFYNNPGKNIFLNLGLGVWDTYGMASGIVGDLLSYIRLFALGLSSAVLGMVFNTLSLSLLSLPPVLGHILFVVLLLIGHTMNLFLAALGSFVHPMRLTFVEFYKNAGFMGGGKEYKPFTKSI